jgi:biotin carboxyl carrier protein
MEGPMLFPRHPLPSGPQACFLSEKRIRKVKGDKGTIHIDKIKTIGYRWIVRSRRSSLIPRGKNRQADLWVALPAVLNQKEKETERRLSMAHNVTAPMVGKIVDIKVKVGDQVKEDDEIAVLEAMKMEMPIVAPASGVVKEIKVSIGQTCETDMVLAVIE